MDIIYLTLCWVAGIVIANYLHISLPFGSIALGLTLIWAFIWPQERVGRGRLMLACVALFAWGGFRLQAAQPDQSPQHISHLNNRGWVRLVGIVDNDPEYGDTWTRVRLSVETVTWLARERPTEGTVLVWLPAHSDVAYGNRILVSGELRSPPRLDDYDYREKMARQGVHSTLNADRYRVLSTGRGSRIRDWLFDLNHQAQDFIEDALSEPQASLLTGILLGDDSGLSLEVKDAFNATGTSHIIAISGFNMTLIAGTLAAFLKRLTIARSWQVVIGLGVMAIYTMFVGGNGAVVRAAIMSGVLLTAPLIERRTYVPASLAFTALVMSIYDPWVLWDIGFQLSFASVLGMAMLTPSLDRALRGWLAQAYGNKTSERLGRWLSEPLVVSIAAQVFTLPLILHYFERLSPIAPFTNLLIVPVQALILFSGGIATIISFVIPALGAAIYQISWLFLTWTTTIVRQSANLSFASVELSLPAWIVLSLAGGALIMTILNARRPAWFRVQPGELLWSATMIIGLILLATLGQHTLHQPDGKLHIIYLDMGQSNSALIQTPNGAVILIDGGRYPSRLLTTLGDHLPDKIIDVLYITSDEEEDIAGLIDVVERYEIGVVITAVTTSDEPDYYALLNAMQQEGIPVLGAEAGERIETDDGVQLLNLHNLALRLEYGEAVFLFTNELPLSEEEHLLADVHLVQATVLQAADHAADKSNSQTWVDTVNPQIVVVHNDPSHWNPGAIGHVMSRFEGRQLYRTDEHGTIEIITDGDTLDIYTE